jgi:VIT1/CCC1 family predicted Fe2+/Mn2+ transporter
MTLKYRLRESITTFIGISFLIGSLIMIVMNLFYEKDFAAWSTIIPISLLGWVFLWSKNSLLEGITLGLFKIKDNEEGS